MLNSHSLYTVRGIRKLLKRELTKTANRKTLSNGMPEILFSSRVWMYNVGSHLLSSNPNPRNSNDRYFLSPFQRSKQGVYRCKQKIVLHHFKEGWGRRRKRKLCPPFIQQPNKVTLLLDSLGSHPTRWPGFSSHLEAVLICIFRS